MRFASEFSCRWDSLRVTFREPSVCYVRQRNSVWGRVENVDRTNELPLDGNPEPPGFVERFLARVQAYTLGYDREIHLIPYLAMAPGGQITFYGVPSSLQPLYGARPFGVAVSLRLRPSSRN